MSVPVSVQTVLPLTLAAVRREVAPHEIGSVWGPAVGKVWDFIRTQPGLWTDGHNIFVYHHSNKPGVPILCDFGVEVTPPLNGRERFTRSKRPGERLLWQSTVGRTTA